MDQTEHFRFSDIIALPHHVSPTRPQMKRIDRAAQFSPFAALTGYAAAIWEAGRQTQPRIELSEDEKAILDRKQAVLLEQLDAHPEVTVTYFVPDAHKDGGSYVSRTDHVKRIDAHRRLLLLCDDTAIALDEILNLDSPIFNKNTYF